MSGLCNSLTHLDVINPICSPKTMLKTFLLMFKMFTSGTATSDCLQS